MSEAMGEEATEFVSEAPAAVAEPPAEQPEGQPEGQPEEQQFDPQQEVQRLSQMVEQLQQAQQQIPEQLAAYFQQQQSPQEQQGFDWSQIQPYEDDFGQQLGQGIRAEIEQAMGQVNGALAPIVEQQQVEQASQFVDQVFDYMQVPTENIEGLNFSERDIILNTSMGLSHQGLDPRRALAGAREMQKAYWDAAYKAGRASQVQDLEALRQAPESPQAQGSNGAVQARQPAQSLEESARAISARLGIPD